MTGTSTKIGLHLEGYDNGDNTHWEVCKARESSCFYVHQGFEPVPQCYDVTILLLPFLLLRNFCITLVPCFSS